MNIQKAIEIFDELQRRSENFKYGEVFSLEDRKNEIFEQNKHFINQEPEIVFENRFYYSNTFDYLAQQRGCQNDAELFSKTSEEFSKKYKGHFKDAMAVKDHLIGYLNQSLFPKYFSRVKDLNKHYLHSEYSEYLFTENPKAVISVLACFYTGNYDRIKRNLSEFIIGGEYCFDVHFMDLESSVNSALKKLLLIQDAYSKVQVLLQFPENTIYKNPDMKNRVDQFWDSNKKERTSTDKPESNSYDDIKQMIENIARRRSRGKYSNDYQTIVDALSLYHENTDMFDYEVAEKAGVPPSTFNTWKKELDEKLV